jgi:AcrR family transcriptional regulator
MLSSDDDDRPGVQAKAKYHHGDLREALISAVHKLVIEEGADSVSLAVACRRAGVSTAAPYRHFRDRDEILAEVAARGFETLNQKAAEVIALHGKGTVESITAMAKIYVGFAVEQQGMFRLMFGQQPTLSQSPLVRDAASTCFGYVINQISRYCEAEGVEGDADDIALKLWTFVHGAASLLINEKYDTVTSAVSVERMIDTVTPSLLGQGNSGAPAKR